jgi:hypothetical protein
LSLLDLHGWQLIAFRDRFAGGSELEEGGFAAELAVLPEIEPGTA